MACGCVHQVAYPPGLSTRRIADLYPGQAKTDACDAFISADSARTMPHTLCRVDTGDDTRTELGVLAGFDDDLAGEATRISNRIRRLLTGIRPALERVLGPRITHRAVLEILSRCGGPAGHMRSGLLQTGRDRHQTCVAYGRSKLACSLKEVLQQRNSIGDDVERMLDDHSLSRVLTSVQGVGVRTGVRILLEVGNGSAFASAGHLAAYAGIAPATHRSGISIRGERPPGQVTANSSARRSSRLSLYATTRPLHLLRPKTRRRQEHNAALICLIRRRCDVVCAMLKNKTLYPHQSDTKSLERAPLSREQRR